MQPLMRMVRLDLRYARAVTLDRYQDSPCDIDGSDFGEGCLLNLR